MKAALNSIAALDAKIGVLGKNGSGKSTLLRIMAGIERNSRAKPRSSAGFTARYLSQEPQLNPDRDVFGNVEEAVEPIRKILRRFDEINARLGEPLEPDEMEKLLDEQAKVQDQIELHNAWELDRQIEIAMDAMNLPPGDSKVDTLSGGERRRVALCKILLEQPDLLLLDEPTNHLDAESVAWLERHLADYPGTVVAVTHDRYFLDNVAGWILELDRGQGIPWEGNYSSWLQQKRDRLAQEEKAASVRQKTLDKELEWVRMAPRARQAKNKARLQAYEKMSAEQNDARQEELEIQILPGKHLGDLVVEAQHVFKGYGDRLLIEDLSFRLPPGGIVGVIGANGVGKTTLFRMIMGLEKPDQGVFRVGETVELGYVDQNRDALDPAKTIFQEISGGHDTLDMGGRKLNARSYVARFNFQGTDQQKLVGNLSGGERNRVHLAKLLRQGTNVLLVGRTDQRPRRRHPASPGRGDRQLRRLCGRHQPRSLVSRSRGHAHPGFRRGQLRPLVRRQFRNLRAAAPRAARNRGRSAAPHPLQEIAALIVPARRAACRGGLACREAVWRRRRHRAAAATVQVA